MGTLANPWFLWIVAVAATLRAILLGLEYANAGTVSAGDLAGMAVLIGLVIIAVMARRNRA